MDIHKGSSDDEIFYELDGAPPNYHLAVRDFLENNLQGHWIGRREPIEFSPWSRDLSSMDYYLWGTVKGQVYRHKPRTLKELHRGMCSDLH
ncbi:hypothetical protein C0J52_15983 [Blattella germanica]|nr:hypothetical protein C0J52_15983 [Blattella germanica]